MKKKKEKGKKSVEANSTRLAMIIVFCSSEPTSQNLFASIALGMYLDILYILH